MRMMLLTSPLLHPYFTPNPHFLTLSYPSLYNHNPSILFRHPPFPPSVSQTSIPPPSSPPASGSTKPVATRERIKRPMNAFIIFSSEERTKVHGCFPSLPTSLVSRLLSERWRALGEEGRRPYFLRQEELKRKHQQDHPDYVYTPRQAKKKTQ